MLHCADLFCGAGGTSTGLALAARELGKPVDLLAINHWDTAIATHRANHPWARHLCETLDSVDPRKVVPGGRLNILAGSPECTHHSIARGGKPCSDQSRASAFHILRWAEALRIDNILIENVREFQTWGPLGANGRPLKSRKGETFRKFLEMLASLGYRVEYRVLNAADYGDATTRHRLFIMARRGNKPITWPDPTHSPAGGTDLFSTTQSWRPARDIIDWSIKGQPLSERKRPLSANTIARIRAGLKKFGGEPFLAVLNGTQPGQISATAKSTGEPLPTLTGSGHVALCQPFLLPHRTFKNMSVDSIDNPLRTITAHSSDFALVEPFIINMEHSKKKSSHSSIGKPMPTITTADAFGLVEPFLITVNHAGSNESRSQSVNQPLSTVTTKRSHALVQPFIMKFYGTGITHSVEEPLDTITTKDRFALVEPERHGLRLDIRFRMLQPHELARAMSFPDDYQFTGTRDQKVKQIGNAVPVQLARHLCKSLLS